MQGCRACSMLSDSFRQRLGQFRDNACKLRSSGSRLFPWRSTKQSLVHFCNELIQYPKQFNPGQVSTCVLPFPRSSLLVGSPSNFDLGSAVASPAWWAGLAAGYPDVHIGIRHLGIRSPCKPPTISNSAGKGRRLVCASPLPYPRRHLGRPVLTMRVGGRRPVACAGASPRHSSHVALLSYKSASTGTPCKPRTLFTVEVSGCLHHPGRGSPGCPGGSPAGLPQHHRLVDGGGAGGTGRPARRAVAERRHCAQGARGSHGSPRQPAPGDRQAAASGRGAATHSKRCGSGRQPGCGAIAQPCPCPVAGVAGQLGSGATVTAAMPGA